MKTPTFAIPRMFAALSEPNRLKMIEMIATKGSLTASKISSRFCITPSAVSQHLKILRQAQLLQMEKQAQRRIYTINPAAISYLQSWSDRMTLLWNERFDTLQELIKE